MKRLLIILLFSFSLHSFAETVDPVTARVNTYLDWADMVKGYPPAAACPPLPYPYYPWAKSGSSCYSSIGNNDLYAIFNAADTMLYYLTGGAYIINTTGCPALPNPYYPYDANCNDTRGNNDDYAIWYVLHAIDSVLRTGGGGGGGNLSGTLWPTELLYGSATHTVHSMKGFNYIGGNIVDSTGSIIQGLYSGQNGVTIDPNYTAPGTFYMTTDQEGGAQGYIFANNLVTEIGNNPNQLYMGTYMALYSPTSPLIIQSNSADTWTLNGANLRRNIIVYLPTEYNNDTLATTKQLPTSFTISGQGVARIVYSQGSNKFGCSPNFNIDTTRNILLWGQPTKENTSVAQFTSSVNTYNQLVVRNSNGSARASSNLVLENNQDSTHYADWFFNSSTNTDSTFDAVWKSGSGIYNAQAGMWIGSGGTDTVGFFDGGTLRTNRVGYFTTTGLTLTAPLSIANGGTGATIDSTARKNLGFTSILPSADQSTTSTGAVNLSGVLFAAAANTTYFIDGVIVCGTTSTQGIKFGLTVPSGATGVQSYTGPATSYALVYTEAPALGSLTGVALVQQANTGQAILVKCVVTTSSTPGNLQFQFASGSTLNTVTVNKFNTGTYLSARKIP